MVRPVGTLEDFQNGLADTISSLVMANELGRTTRAMYIWGTSFVRLSLLRSDRPHTEKDAVFVVIEDQSIDNFAKKLSANCQDIDDLLLDDFASRCLGVCTINPGGGLIMREWMSWSIT